MRYLEYLPLERLEPFKRSNFFKVVNTRQFIPYYDVNNIREFFTDQNRHNLYNVDFIRDKGKSDQNRRLAYRLSIKFNIQF